MAHSKPDSLGARPRLSRFFRASGAGPGQQDRTMNATVLVVGASGLVGSALLREFSQHCRTIGTFCHNAVPDLMHLDLRDCEEVRSVLHSVHPDVVLCPAADPNVEFCEAEPIATRQVNVDGLQTLLAATAEAGALLVYFSSEYVFDGKKGTYSETDACN